MALVPTSAHLNAPADKGTRFADLFTKMSNDAQPPPWSQSSIGRMGTVQRMLFRTIVSNVALSFRTDQPCSASYGSGCKAGCTLKEGK